MNGAMFIVFFMKPPQRLPPPEGKWPNPALRDMTTESIDVFLVCRTWYEFAQKPLPPPDPTPRMSLQEYDKLRVYKASKALLVYVYGMRANTSPLKPETWTPAEEEEFQPIFELIMPNEAPPAV
mgnify:CR=1 FL=1